MSTLNSKPARDAPALPSNVDHDVVQDFGYEWRTFDQSALDSRELEEIFDTYFDIFPFDLISKESVGFDMGCGSGRWAMKLAPRVRTLHCIDASQMALDQAKKTLAHVNNCAFECASVADTSLADESQDFGYSLGVLHHIPDTYAGIQNCVRKLKVGSPFLIYLYYAMDNKPGWFRILWKLSDHLRFVLSKLPFGPKLFLSQLIAAGVYLPLARLSWVLEKLGVDVRHMPLCAYRDRSFYVMRTDSLDRFGTKLEQRFTRAQILSMLSKSGLEQVRFSEKMPYWVAVGLKAAHVNPAVA